MLGTTEEEDCKSKSVAIEAESEEEVDLLLISEEDLQTVVHLFESVRKERRKGGSGKDADLAHSFNETL